MLNKNNKITILNINLNFQKIFFKLYLKLFIIQFKNFE